MALQSSVELDPIFLKALRLLHSVDPDSTAQLKALVEEERSKRRGEIKTDKGKSFKKEQVVEQREQFAGGSDTAQDSQIVIVASSSNIDISSVQPIDTVSKTSPFDLVETVEELSSSSFHDIEEDVYEIGSGSAALPKEIDFEEVILELDSSSFLEPTKKKARLEDHDEGGTDEEMHDSEKTSPLLLDDAVADPISLHCVVCKIKDRDPAPDNSLVECHECHSYFHQKCHKPPINSKDANDPRLIFYCLTCTRQMKKEMAAQQQQQQQQVSSSKVKQPSIQATRPVSNPFQLGRQSIQPFRRPSTSSTSSAAQSSTTETAKANSGTGATTSLVRSQSPTQLLSSSPSQGSHRIGPSVRPVLPQDAALKSMKRLENLKKKAKIQQMRTKR